MPNARSSYLGKVIIEVGHLVKLALPLAGGLALLFFLWGITVTIFKAGDEKAVEEGKNRAKWGIIALFVIVALWGIINLLGSIVGVPYIPVQQNSGVDNAPDNGSRLSV